MSTILKIELTDEEEARLRESASAEGKGMEELVRGLIAGLPEPVRSTETGSTPGALLLDQLRSDGALGVWKDRADSPELARELRRRAEARGGAQ